MKKRYYTIFDLTPNPSPRERGALPKEKSSLRTENNLGTVGKSHRSKIYEISYTHNLRLLKQFIIFFILAHNTTAQTTLQVATKHVEKVFSGSQSLNIEAEKADIEVITWNGQEIKVEIELIAKHPDRRVASNDLETMKYVADKTKKDVFLRNYLLIKDEKAKPMSNLKAKYTVKIPEGMKVTIQNSFGKILVKGKIKLLKIKSDFCLIDLNEVEGKTELTTHYGEINVRNINGVLTVTSERSDLIINDLAGRCAVNSQYGRINIEGLTNLKKLTINAKKSEINLNKISLNSHAFRLTTTYGKLVLPAGFKEFSWLENSDVNKTAILNTTHPSKIDIVNIFGNINLNN